VNIEWYVLVCSYMCLSIRYKMGSQKVPGMLLLRYNNRTYDVLQDLPTQFRSRTLAHTHTCSIDPATVGIID
jgi:hypothetical protein